MGDVYRANDHRNGDDVAIKVLRTGVLQGEERFAGEVEMLRRLDHPNVVGVVGAGEQDGMPYLVMELLPGRSLSDLVRDGRMELDRVQRVGAQIAAALHYAHGRGVINRDVKPSNILFTTEGTAKLADFGIAKLLDASGITGTGQAVGTASYIAPEQLSAPDRVGPPTDVYSLGLVLLEAATGVRAFVGTGTEAAMARLARDPLVPGDLPEPWRRLLPAMTARDPEARPTAGEVAELLDRDFPDAAVQALPLPASPADDATVPMRFVGDGVLASTSTAEDEETVVLPTDGAATHRIRPDAEPAAATAPAAAAGSGSSGSTGRRVVVAVLALIALGAAVAFALSGDEDPGTDEQQQAPVDAPAEDEDPADEEPADGDGETDSKDPPAETEDEPGEGNGQAPPSDETLPDDEPAPDGSSDPGNTQDPDAEPGGPGQGQGGGLDNAPGQIDPAADPLGADEEWGSLLEP